MKILAGLAAVSLLAMPAFAQGASAQPAPSGADAGKPADDAAPPADDPAPAGTTDASKPAGAAATPEPEEAPEGTEPVKPADQPQS